ncbi:MAG: CHAP domain-containing protein [bacterium]
MTSSPRSPADAKRPRISRLSQNLPYGGHRLASTPSGNSSTSSHTNTQPNLKIGGKNQISVTLQDWMMAAKKSIQTGGAWRYASHVLLIALVSCIALAGKIQADSIQVSQARGFGAEASDQSTMLASGAVLAEQTNLVIAPDIQAAANSAASQMQLATTSDGFLTKKAPIASGEASKRGLTNYVVVAGDTISTIAQKNNVTSDTVLWVNNLAEDSVLKPGQSLIILPTNGLLFSAQGGESLDQLAETYQASANLIDSYNQLEGKPLVAGQKIIIPDGIKPTPKPVTVARVASTQPSTRSLSNYSGGANGYSFGYCTWYVASRRGIPTNWGNASTWYYNAAASGYGVGSTPRAGAVAWENGNHVAYVESVGNGTVTVSEMNFWGNGGGWNRVSYRTTDASHFKYIY